MSRRPEPGPADSWQAAADILAERDPVMHRLVAEVGPPHVRPPAETHFEALARAIVYQQLAGAAAAVRQPRAGWVVTCCPDMSSVSQALHRCRRWCGDGVALAG